MNGRPWKTAELRYLEAHYAMTPTPELAQSLERPIRSVYAKASALGLKKPAEFYRRHGAGRLTSRQGLRTRFRTGQKPWNKGLKGWKAGGRATETQFKKGRSPQESRNYQPIGTTRMHKSDYLEKKVTDDRSIYPAKRWQPVHRLVWEAAHGPVPPGHLVVFRSGMKTRIEAEITVDRLEMISRRENMRRNSYHTNYPPELRQIVQLQGALKRKINNREKDDEQQNDQRFA